MPEAKVRVRKKILADGSRVCRVNKYARVEELPAKDEQRVIAALHDCQVDPHTSEYSASFPDLTGRYEGRHWIACVNQAGLQVEVWYSRKLTGASGGVNRNVYRYSGVFDPERGVFDLEGKSGKGEMIDAGGRPARIAFEFEDSSTSQVTRFSRRATLSDRAVDALREATKDHGATVAGAVDNEHAPLGPRRTDAADRLLTAPALFELLAKVFAIEPTPQNRTKIQERIEVVDSYFRPTQPGDPPHEPTPHWFERTFAEADRAKVKAFCRRVLHGHELELTGHGGAVSKLRLYE